MTIRIAVRRHDEAVPAAGIVAIADDPSSFRSALICTCRLFSSTTKPGQTRSISSLLGHDSIASLRQGEQDVECPGADGQGLAVLQQAAAFGLQLEASENQHGNSLKAT
jgi:hypothetical protein